MCPLRAFGGVHGVAAGGRANRKRGSEGNAYAGRKEGTASTLTCVTHAPEGRRLRLSLRKLGRKSTVELQMYGP